MKKETGWTRLGLILLGLSRPFVWAGRWLRNMSWPQRAVVIIGSAALWWSLTTKSEPAKLPTVPTINSIWLIVLGAVVVLGIVIMLLANRKGKASTRTNVPPANKSQPTGPNPGWPPQFPVIPPVKGINSKDFYAFVLGLLVLLCLGLGILSRYRS